MARPDARWRPIGRHPTPEGMADTLATGWTIGRGSSRDIIGGLDTSKPLVSRASAIEDPRKDAAMLGRKDDTPHEVVNGRAALEHQLAAREELGHGDRGRLRAPRGGALRRGGAQDPLTRR